MLFRKYEKSIEEISTSKLEWRWSALSLSLFPAFNAQNTSAARSTEYILKNNIQFNENK